MFAANVAQLEHWNKAFEAFLARNSSNLTDKQVRGAAIIQIHHIICKTIAKGAPSLEDPRPSSVAWHNPDDREYFDKSLNQVINLSRSLIVAGEADARAGKAPLHFSMDLGIVAPLYYVGVKMRDPEQRLAALELLERVPWKEGLWDNTSCARLVKQFWEMETMYLETAAADPTFDASMRCGAIELEFADDAKCKWT
ncbi:hypothetical protein PVAG01_02722 [Phlyctema vagabunda]|uniref:Uncharacterized protein n=1 Tax=Phlyctema vagabunda TaxID=108571 RepID=A0ABR4PSP4_9HELO